VGWSGSFDAALAAGGKPRFSVAVVPAPLLGGLFPSSTPTFESHTGHGGSALLSVSGFDYDTGRLDIQQWNVQGGGARINVALKATDGATIANLRRGQIVALTAHFGAVSERIWCGTLWNVVSSHDSLQEVTLECRGITNALVTRLVGSASDLRLYEDLVSDTSRTHGIFTGSWSPGTSNLVMSSTTGTFEQEAGGRMLVLCDPGGTVGTISGSAFYLSIASYTSGTLTLNTPLDVDLFGTTRASLTSGSPIYLVPAVLQSAPIAAAFKIITSTGASQAGTALNGAYDLLPIEWGAGFPSTLVDYGDVYQQNALTLDNGGAAILMDVFRRQEPYSNPRTLIAEVLNPMGVCLVQRQGSLTVRVCQDPTSVTNATGFTISDASLAPRGVRVHNAFAPSFLESPDVTWEDAAGKDTASTNRLVSSLPTRAPQTYTASHLWGSNAVPVQGTRNRMQRWLTTMPETATLALHGLSAAELCPGDLPNCTITSDKLRSLRPGGLGVSDQRVLVLSVRVSWFGTDLETEVEVMAAPEDVQ